MKKAIVISVAAVVGSLGATGVAVTIKKSAVKKVMMEEFDVTVKSLMANIKMDANVDLKLVHDYETSLVYKLEHNVPIKEADGIAMVRAMETELNDIAYKLSAMEEEDKDTVIRVVSDIMMSSIDSMNRDIQRRQEQKEALANATMSAIQLTGNIATAAVATASAVDDVKKMEEKKEASERLETKEG